jgi:hypothetical protein
MNKYRNNNGQETTPYCQLWRRGRREETNHHIRKAAGVKDEHPLRKWAKNPNIRDIFLKKIFQKGIYYVLIHFYEEIISKERDVGKT